MEGVIFCPMTVTFSFCRGLPVKAVLPKEVHNDERTKRNDHCNATQTPVIHNYFKRVGLVCKYGQILLPKEWDGGGKAKTDTPRCKNCGGIIYNQSGVKPRLFCSNHCKQAWWNKHRHERESENILSHVCQTCGKAFNDYGRANRKYCSQACYWKRNKCNEK